MVVITDQKSALGQEWALVFRREMPLKNVWAANLALTEKKSQKAPFTPPQYRQMR